MISFQRDTPEPGDAEAFEAALLALKTLARGKNARPSRKDARALLVPMGTLLPSWSSDALAAALERIREVTKGFPEAWRAAISEELELACTEYVTSVDERYLGMKDYDFAYTSGARERLEARLRACAAMGHPLPEGMLRRIAGADAIYAPYLKRSRDGG